jgi:hypothetical protein
VFLLKTYLDEHHVFYKKQMLKRSNRTRFCWCLSWSIWFDEGVCWCLLVFLVFFFNEVRALWLAFTGKTIIKHHFVFNYCNANNRNNREIIGNAQRSSRKTKKKLPM